MALTDEQFKNNPDDVGGVAFKPFETDFEGKKIVVRPSVVAQILDLDLNDSTGAGGSLIQRHIVFDNADATPSVLNANLCETTGTTTITDFDDGVIGQIIWIKANGNIIITDGATIILDGGANYAMVNGDTLLLVMFDDQVWHEIGRGTIAGQDHGALAGLADDDHTQYLKNIVEDTTPQLGGDLDLNSKNIDFPTTSNISDCLDEDDMASNSATKIATQQSIKKYVDDTRSGLGIYGDGSDGAATISSNTTLTSDKYYTNLTVNNTITLTTDGYRVFVNGTLTLTGSGKISNIGTAGGNGGNGANGTLSSQGVGGSVGTAGSGGGGNYFTLGEDGKVGQVGGIGQTGAGANGTNGTTGADATPRALSGNGSASGAGGVGGATGGGSNGTAGTSASGGTATSSSILQKPFAVPNIVDCLDVDSTPALQPYQAGAGGGSGGSGAGGTGNVGSGSVQGGGGGGGSGGSGGNGGFVGVYAKDVVYTGSGLITASGGNGGAGGDGGDGYSVSGACGGGGGGGGGAGGTGGVVIFVYSTFDDGLGGSDPSTVYVKASAGTGGAKGNKGTSNGGAGDPFDGAAGSNGGAGVRVIIQN